jgi:hypothetical protein
VTDSAAQERGRDGGAGPEEGHVRRVRLLALSALGIVLVVGLLLVMVQGTLEASLTIAGPAGKLSADRFVARGTVEYPLVEGAGADAVPVLTDGFRQAEATNFCFSLPVADLPGVGPVVARIATPGERGFRADDLMATAEEIRGHLVRRGAQFSRDAALVDAGPPGATGQPGRFGLQSAVLEADDLRIVTRSVAGTVRLDAVRVAVGGRAVDCY